MLKDLCIFLHGCHSLDNPENLEKSENIVDLEKSENFLKMTNRACILSELSVFWYNVGKKEKRVGMHTSQRVRKNGKNLFKNPEKLGKIILD